MLSFRDVVIVPYAGRPPFRRGGPRWPDWEAQTAARQCAWGAPQDEEPPPAEPTATLPGPLAWAGAISGHFGHQISNFSARLLPTLAELPGARFAFTGHVERRVDSLDATQPFFPQILDWYGIPPEDVEVISEPTLVRHLVVAPQAEQHVRPGPEPWYLDLLDANADLRLGKVVRSGSLYVSRAGQRGRFAGEAYIERAMREAGFGVLRPETVSLAEQLRAYASAETLVFAEGSAVHGTQLLGRALGDVTILNRRRAHRLARAALVPRAQSLRYVDAVWSLVHGLNRGGNAALYRGISVLDLARLRAELPIAATWDEDAFDAAVEADVREWLEVERASPRWPVPGTRELVAERLREAGLGHLADI